MDRVELTLNKIVLPLAWLCWKLAIFGRGHFREQYLEVKSELDNHYVLSSLGEGESK